MKIQDFKQKITKLGVEVNNVKPFLIFDKDIYDFLTSKKRLIEHREIMALEFYENENKFKLIFVSPSCLYSYSFEYRQPNTPVYLKIKKDDFEHLTFIVKEKQELLDRHILLVKKLQEAYQEEIGKMKKDIREKQKELESLKSFIKRLEKE